MQRGVRLRSHLRRSLWSSLMTARFWTEVRPTAIAQVSVGAIAGIVAGGLAGWLGVLIGASKPPLVLSGTPLGAGELLLFIMQSMIACIIVYVFLNPILGSKILEEVIKGGADTDAAKSVVSLLLHKPRGSEIDGAAQTSYLARLLKPSVVEGTIHGVIVGAGLIGAGLH